MLIHHLQGVYSCVSYSYELLKDKFIIQRAQYVHKNKINCNLNSALKYEYL